MITKAALAGTAYILVLNPVAAEDGQFAVVPNDRDFDLHFEGGKRK